MKIEELISKRNEELYARISRKLDIRLEPMDNEGWGALIKGNTGIIYYSQCKNPEESFSHELLHFDCQLNGFCRPKYSLIENSLNTHYLDNLLDALDNELQHHKIYSDYLQMGYNANAFFKGL